MCHMSSPCQQLSDSFHSRGLYAKVYSDCFYIGQQKEAQVGNSYGFNKFYISFFYLKTVIAERIRHKIWQFDMSVWIYISLHMA